MAGEYSQDLSTQVFIGQCRITSLGLWHGGAASYGLRRRLIDEFGVPKAQLEYGQRKSLQTDRVVLKPGPAFEVSTVRQVFKSFVIGRKSVTEIAKELNAKQIRTIRGNLWRKANKLTKFSPTKFTLGISYSIEPLISSSKSPLLILLRCGYGKTRHWRPIYCTRNICKSTKTHRKASTADVGSETLARLSALSRKRGHLSNDIIIAAKAVPIRVPISNASARSRQPIASSDLGRKLATAGRKLRPELSISSTDRLRASYRTSKRWAAVPTLIKRRACSP